MVKRRLNLLCLKEKKPRTKHSGPVIFLKDGSYKIYFDLGKYRIVSIDNKKIKCIDCL